MSSEAKIGEPTPERTLSFAFAYAPTLILEAAIRLGIFDALSASGPAATTALAKNTGASERGVGILCNALVGLDFLSKDKQGRYALTAESEAFLVSSSDRFVGGLYRHTSRQILPSWLQLCEIVRTGQPAKSVNQEEIGTEFFANFIADLMPMNQAAATALADELAINDGSVLDLASGSGIWGIAIARRSAAVRIRAVDWEGVLPITRRITAEHGVAGQFDYSAGDLMEAHFGSGHRAAILGHILHSEGAQRSRQILKRISSAMTPGGTIAIAEWLVDANRCGPLNGLIFAVNMLVHTDCGDTFSFAEISAWLADAGFSSPRLLDVPGPSPLILAEKTA